VAAEPEFYLDAEVEAITRTVDPTRRRMERRGLFPKRVRISPRRNGWRCFQVMDWVNDPAGWPQRQAEKAKRALDNADSSPSNTALSPYRRWRADRAREEQANG